MKIGAYRSSCYVVCSDSPDLSPGSQNFGDAVLKLAYSLKAGVAESEMAVVDLSGPVSESAGTEPLLYCVWVYRTKTPSIFSISCAGEHLRRHLSPPQSPIMTIFNDLGDAENGIDAASYILLLKKVDLEKLRCVPVGYTTLQKRAISERIKSFAETAGSEEVNTAPPPIPKLRPGGSLAICGVSAILVLALYGLVLYHF